VKTYFLTLGCSLEDGTKPYQRYFAIQAESRFWAMYTAVRWALSKTPAFRRPKNVTSLRIRERLVTR
jgi:hypothetical protein